MKKNHIMHYDAFISYRHTPLDMFVAKQIQRKLEGFVLPKKLKKKQADWEKKKIHKLFRDQDELPITSDLSNQIYMALEASEYLIVICSPRLKESLWCQEEIKTFIEMKGYEHVLPVLIEGEPEESFPHDLVYRQEYVTDEEGNQQLCTVAVEPLAADVRGKSHRDIRKKIDEEIYRLLAPMFQVSFDDLKQRSRERKMKKTFRIVGAVTAFFTAFGLYSGYQALRISKQNDEIAKQSKVLEEQKNEITLQNEELQAQYDAVALSKAKELGNLSLDYLSVGEQDNALSYGLMSITQDEDGNMLPLTSEGLSSLIHSTYAYESSFGHLSETTISFEDFIEKIEVSPSDTYVLVEDRSGQISIIDSSTLEVIAKVDGNGRSDCFKSEDMIEKTMFLSDQTIFFTTDQYFGVYDFVTDSFDYSYSYTKEDTSYEMLRFIIPVAGENKAYLMIGSVLYQYQSDSKELIPFFDLNDNVTGEPLFEYQATIDRTKSVLSIIGRHNIEEGNSIYEVFTYDVHTGEFLGCVSLPEFHSVDHVFYQDGKLVVLGDVPVEEGSIYMVKHVNCYQVKWGNQIYSNCIFNASQSGEQRLINQVSEDCDFFSVVVGNEIYSYRFSDGEIFYSNQFDGDIFPMRLYPPDMTLGLGLTTGKFEQVSCTNNSEWVCEADLGIHIQNMIYIADRFFLVHDRSNQLIVTARQAGLRMETYAKAYKGNFDCMDQGMTRIFSHDYSKLYAYDLESGNMIWEKEESVDFLAVTQAGDLVGFGNKKLYVFDENTGEIIYSEMASVAKIAAMDLTAGTFYYYDRDHNDMIVFKSSTKENSVLYHCDDNLSFGSDSVVSKDGKSIITTDSQGKKFLFYQEGKKVKELDHEVRDVVKIMFLPDTNNYLVQYLDGHYDVYSIKTWKCVYSSEDCYVQFESVSEGGKSTPFILNGSMGYTYFMDANNHIVYDQEHGIYPISADYFGVVNGGNFLIFPFYDVEMLKEDADRILNQNENNIVDIGLTY